MLVQQLVGRHAELEAVATALAAPDVRGVAFIGPAGAGKTRLAEEACRLAGLSGMEVVTALVTSGSSGIPLGALAHLLPPAGSLEDVHADLQPTHLFRAVRDALSARAGRRPLVLMVDDAQHLDGMSAHLVHQLATAGDAFVVLTIRAGEAVPGPISALWTQRVIERVDLGPLPQEECLAMAAGLLGGPLDTRSESWLWRTSGGNALYLRELVLGARDGGTLVNDRASGRWRFADDQGHVSSRLAEVVDHRLAGLPAELRRAVDVVALAEPVGLAIVEQITGLEPLADLEDRGLVRVYQEQRREYIRTAHPLYGEAIRQQPLTMRRRSDLRALADAVEARGARRREDPVRVAGWRLAAGATVDPAVLLRAALAAQYSHSDHEAIRLARLALEPEHPRSEPLDREVECELCLCLGSALGRQGRFDEGLLMLDRAQNLATKPETIARIAMRLSFTAGERHEDLPGAEKVLVEALETIPADSQWVTDLSLQLALLRGEHGEGHGAAAALAPVAGEPAEPNQAVTYFLAAAAAALTTGRFSEARALSDRGYEVHRTVPALDSTFHPVSQRYNTVLADLMLGELAAADYNTRWMLDRAIEDGRPIGRVVMSNVMATTHLIRGQLTVAAAYANAALAAFAPGMQPYLLRWARANLARIDAAAGRAADALDAVPAITEGMPTHPVMLGGSAAIVAEVEVKAAAGRRAEAVDVARDGIDVHRARGDVRGWLETAEAILTRWPDRDVVDVIGDFPASPDGRRAEALMSLIEAVHAGGDAAALAAVADRYRAIDFRLSALQITEHAVDRATKAGNDRLRMSLATRVADDLAACDGVISWAMSATSVVPLTDREREIAELVAAGRSSKSVAEELYLSVRTVDNHLQRIYVKLGVSSRAELAKLLGRER